MNPRLQIFRIGRRLHLQDGPTDLIIQAFGAQAEIEAAYAAAATRMATILDELCSELEILRRPAPQHVTSPVAIRMAAAVAPYATHFITPMAAVAGAVADEILTAMLRAATLTRAYVNNGGDIAFHLTRNESFTTGIIANPDSPTIKSTLTIHAATPTRGIATSGWRGRSHSRGIADAVTVTAANAAAADAAATIIANAVDLPHHPAITRTPAHSLNPQSDLGPRLVTTAVAPLSAADVQTALAAGAAQAQTLLNAGRVTGATLHLQNQNQTITREPAFA